MPIQLRLRYSSLYDDFSNYETHRVDDRTAWMELAAFDDATELNHEDLIRLRGIINRLRWLNDIVADYWPVTAGNARALGVNPKHDPADPPPHREVCLSYLSAGAAGQ
jgi:hypothetical protein